MKCIDTSLGAKLILQLRIPKQHITGRGQPRGKQNLRNKRGGLTPEPGRHPASFCREWWTTCPLPAGSLVQSATHYFSFGKLTEQQRREGVHFQDGGAVGSSRGDFNGVQYGFFRNGHTRRGKQPILYSSPYPLF